MITNKKECLNVAVIGSFRPKQPKGEQNYSFKGDIEDFQKSARLLGKYIAEGGHNLLVGWSNDHYSKQVGKGQYHFEDTADYHAMLGFIDKLGNRSKDRLQISASEKLLEIRQLARNFEGFKPFKYFSTKCKLSDEGELNYFDYLRNSEFSSIGVPINEYRNSVVKPLESIPNCWLRTNICKHIASKQEVDLLVILGGGKATMVAVDAAFRKNKAIISFSESGGTSQRYLQDEDYTDQRDLHQNVTNLFDENTKVESPEVKNFFLKSLLENYYSSSDSQTQGSPFLWLKRFINHPEIKSLLAKG